MTIHGFLSLESHLLIVLLAFFPGWKCPAGLETQGVQSAEPAGGRRGGVGREVCSLFLKEKAPEVRGRRLEPAQGPPGVMCPPGCVQVDLSRSPNAGGVCQVLPLSGASIQRCLILILFKMHLAY